MKPALPASNCGGSAISLNGNANGHQAAPDNEPTPSGLGNSEASAVSATPATPVQLAFGFDLAPQEAGHRTPWAKRLQQSGLECYWDIYQALIDSPPTWETQYWQDHDNRRREWPKKALFIAWAAAPSSARRPRTQNEVAEALGVSPQTICNWKSKNPEMTDLINELALAPFEAAVRDVDFVTLWQARQTDSSTAARKLFYERYAEIRAGRNPINPQQVTQILQVIYNSLDWSKLDQSQLERIAAGEDPVAVIVAGSVG